MKEALFYEKAVNDTVNCHLCARHCTEIPNGSTGFCGVRKNQEGVLYSLVYGKACSIAMDPIEKKPLFHFAPGSECLSMATVGCNFRCMQCQNWEISQPSEISGQEISPEKIVEMAKAQGAKGIAYTYTEPTIFYEYAYDTMKLASKAGLYNVWVSNGYTTPEVIKHASKYLDAVNVDVKGNDKFYKKVCMTPGIKPVYDALLAYKKYKVFTEITTLVVPGYNDRQKDILGIVEWIKDNLGVDVPLHFSAFFPQYKLTDVPPTPLKTVEKCHDIAKRRGMNYVYIGNAQTDKESTFCAKCGNTVIERTGYSTTYQGDKCKKCGTKVPVAGKQWTR